MEKAHSSRSKELREWIQLSSVIVMAVSGFYGFILRDIIRPSKEPVALDIVVNLEDAGIKEEQLLLFRASMIAKNPSDRKIYVPAYWFTVRGYNLLNSDLPRNTDHKYILNNKLKGGEFVTTYAPRISHEVLAQQRIIYKGAGWWQPEDISSEEVIFAVPEGKFDYLELRVYYLFTRDKSDLDNVLWVTYEDGGWHAKFNLNKKIKNKISVNEWEKSTESGLNYHIKTLSLWDSEE